MLDAKGGLATLDLTGPAALRPFVVKGLVDAGRTVLVVAATVREAEDLTEELERPRRPRHGRAVPGLGDAPARAAQPAQRHRGPPAGRPAAAAPPRLRRGQRSRCASSSRRSAPCSSRRSRASLTSSRSSCVPATRSSSTTSSRGSSARRTRGSTSSRSGASSPCVAASSTSSRRSRSTRCGWSSSATRSTRSAPSPSPTSARWRRSSAVGTAVPRAAAHRRRTPQGRRARPAPPPAARDHRQARRGHGRRGDGVAGPGARRRDGAARRAAADRQPRPGPRPRAGAHPCARPGRHQRGVPRRQLGRGGQRWHGADRPRGGVPARARRGARRGPGARAGLVGDQPLRARPRRRCPSRRFVPRLLRTPQCDGRGTGRRVLPGRHREGRRRRPPAPRGRAWCRHGPPGPRPRAAHGRGARRARRAGPRRRPTCWTTRGSCRWRRAASPTASCSTTPRWWC